MKPFEIIIYNQKVRDCIKDLQSHPDFDDGWADQRFVGIKARDVEGARRAILRKYPERLGFVIVDIVELPEYA